MSCPCQNCPYRQQQQQQHAKREDSSSHEINGEIPPGRPTYAMRQTMALNDTEVGHNQVLKSQLTERAYGTRAPIHVHPYGGETCVMFGEMTLYMEGMEPMKAQAGDCYWMPPGPRMTGVNTGNTVALMYDTFVAPPGKDVWVVTEEGMDDPQMLNPSEREYAQELYSELPPLAYKDSHRRIY